MKLSSSSSENIQEDMLEINQLIAPIEMKLDDYNQYYLDYPFLYDLRFAYSGLLKASSNWQLLEEIFFNSHSQVSLAEKFFISKSTLKRQIKDINKNLKDSKLQIETRPYRIVGEISNIAAFMSNYFDERYLEEEVPFPISDYEMARQVLVHFIRNEELSLPRYSERHRIFQLLTSIHLLKNNEMQPKRPINREREAGSVWDNFIWHFDLGMHENEIRQMIYRVLEMEAAFDYEPSLNEQETDLAFMVDRFLRTLAMELQIPLNENDRDRIGLKLRFFVQRVISGEHTYRILSNPYVEFLEKSLYVEKKLGEFLIARFWHFFNLKLSVTESYELVYLIIVFWKDLLGMLEFRIRKPRFGIVLDDYPEQISSYYDLLLIHFGNRAHFELIELNEWSSQDFSHYDCMITNTYQLAKKITTTEVLLLSTGLSEVNRSIIAAKKTKIYDSLVDDYFREMSNRSKKGAFCDEYEHLVP